MDNDKKEKKEKKDLASLGKEEIEIINQSIIDQLKAQVDSPNILIASGGAGGAAGSSK